MPLSRTESKISFLVIPVFTPCTSSGDNFSFCSNLCAKAVVHVARMANETTANSSSATSCSAIYHCGIKTKRRPAGRIQLFERCRFSAPSISHRHCTGNEIDHHNGELSIPHTHFPIIRPRTRLFRRHARQNRHAPD